LISWGIRRIVAARAGEARESEDDESVLTDLHGHLLSFDA
jgi:hypothetical protein